MTKEKTLRQKVQTIIEDRSLTDYRIHKDTGIALSNVQGLRSGKKDPGKLWLNTAEIYAEYHDRIYSK